MTVLIYAACVARAYPHATPLTAVPASIEADHLQDILDNAVEWGAYKLEDMAQEAEDRARSVRALLSDTARGLLPEPAARERASRIVCGACRT
jgi:hypothetical protein